MPHPRGSTMRSTERSRRAEANKAWRQRQADADPAYTPCAICGEKLKGMGHGGHRRQHILNGDIDVELRYKCEACGERYETSNQLGDHRRRGHSTTKKKTADDHPDRVERRKYVDSIAKYSYREFIERLLE